MAMFRFKLENWDETKAYIRSLEDQGKSILNDVAKAGAEFAQPLVRDAVARIDPDLAPTVRVKQTKGKSKNKSSATLEVGGKKKSRYAFHLETGHGGNKEDAARPFVRPTIDRNKTRIAEHMKEVFLQKVEVPNR